MSGQGGRRTEELASLHVRQGRQAAAELRQLLKPEQRPLATGRVAYYTLVLLARLRHLERVGLLDSVLSADEQQLLAMHRGADVLQSFVDACVLRDERELCLELISELESGEDPVSAVQPVLLAIADRIAVRELLAHTAQATGLARDAAAAVALYPEAMLALGARAELQLAGLPPESAAAIVWQEVLAAPGWFATESLEVPYAAARTGRADVALARQAVKSRPVLPRRVQLPRELAAAAAAAFDPLDVSLEEIGSFASAGSLYRDPADGHLKICIPLPSMTIPSFRVSLILRDARTGEERRRAALPVERSGGELIADLGERAGPASRCHKMLASIAPPLPADCVKFQIEIEENG